MLIEKENIKNYIPQREPFIMVDELLSADESGFKSNFSIIEKNLFLENERLSESSLVENVAQTCAAGFGYLNSLKEDGKAQLGFIGAVSKLTVHKLPQLNDCLNTEIHILSTFDTIHLVQGTVFRNEEKLIDCQMKIVLA